MVNQELDNMYSGAFRKTWNYILSVAVIILLFLLVFQQCEGQKALAEKGKMYEAISDSLKTWKDKNGLEHAEKQIIQTEDPDDFIEAKTNDKEVIALQQLVKKYEKQLGKQGSVTILKGETIIDTFYTKPIITYVDRTFYKDSIKNKWIDWKYKVTRPEKAIRDSVDFKLTMNYEYSIINKEKSNGLFKKPTPYAEVTNYNPYSTTKVLLTYRVTNEVKPKRFGIGIIGGYGALLTTEPNLGWFVGAGGSYNLIRF